MSRLIRDPPVMSEPYEGWKNEVLAWSIYVEEKTPPKKQGVALFLSLQGDARKAAANVPLADMTKENGLNLVLAELDKFFLKDKDRSAFLAYDKFNQFRRPEGMSIKEFLIKFELLLNTCTTHEVDIPDKIAAYQMLQSVNISQNKREIIVTTLKDFSAENMRNQILRLFCEEQVPVVDQFSQISIKDEQQDEKSNYVMVGSSHNNSYSRNQNNRGRRSRGSNRGHSSHQSRQEGQLRKNKSDEFGNTTMCDFCHSFYHYVARCPDKNKTFEKKDFEYSL